MRNDPTPELIQARERAVHLVDDYDLSFGVEAAKREALPRRLLKGIGRRVRLEPTFRREFGLNMATGNDF